MGLDGTRDLRIFSVFYLVLRAAVMLSDPMMHVGSTLMYTARGLLLFVCSVTVLVIRPYKAERLSAYDGMLLALLGIQCILVNLKLYFLENTGCLWLLAVTMALPQLALIAQVVKKHFETKCQSVNVEMLQK